MRRISMAIMAASVSPLMMTTSPFGKFGQERPVSWWMIRMCGAPPKMIAKNPTWNIVLRATLTPIRGQKVRRGMEREKIIVAPPAMRPISDVLAKEC